MVSRVLFFATPPTVAQQAPLSMGFSRKKKKKYWHEWIFPPPGDFPDPGVELKSPVSPSLADGFFMTASPGKTAVFVIFLLQITPSHNPLIQ